VQRAGFAWREGCGGFVAFGGDGAVCTQAGWPVMETSCGSGLRLVLTGVAQSVTWRSSLQSDLLSWALAGEGQNSIGNPSAAC
jgi:hypothetical protein